jgi:hypothetical protein
LTENENTKARQVKFTAEYKKLQLGIIHK